MSQDKRRPEIFLANHPFSDEGLKRCTAPAGETLEEALTRHEPDPVLRAHLVVHIDGVEVPAELWAKTELAEGALVNAYVQPAGDGDKIIRSILQIAVVALATWVTGGAGGAIASSLFAYAAGSTILVVGGLLINALIPPAVSGANFNPGQVSQTYSIEGARNGVRRYGTVPVVFGAHRFYPDYLGVPIQELVGDQIYVRMLFALGPMPLDFEDIKIGDTPIENFEGVEIEKRTRPTDPPLTLYSNVTRQAQIGSKLVWGAWDQRTTDADTSEISIILGFREGLGRVNDDGSFSDAICRVDVEYRRVGDLAWENARPNAPGANSGIPGNTTRYDFWDDGYDIADWRDNLPVGTPGGVVTFTGAEPGKPIRREIRWAVPVGQYEVRVRRANADIESPEIRDDCHWEILRSITPKSAAPLNELATLAVRIRATDQLNGVIDELNGLNYRVGPALRQAIVDDPLYDLSTVTAADWNEERRIDNPADNLVFNYRGPMAVNPRPDSAMDWPGLAEFHRRCHAAGWKVSWVMDRTMTRGDAAKTICRVGRGRPIKLGNKISVISDYDKSGEERWLFTPRNVAGFRAVKTFMPEVHALRIRFKNKDEGWQDDERLVYADGFSAEGEAGGGPVGTVAATKIETFPLEGIDDAELIWKHGRYWLYTAQLLNESYTFDYPLEAIAGLKPGHMARLQHDVNLVGLGGGRVKEVRLDGGGNVEAIILDEPGDPIEGNLFMEAGKSYGIVWRYVAGTPAEGQPRVSSSLALQTVPGAADELRPAAATLPADAPQAGDLVAFGETGLETLSVLVKNVRKKGRFGATVEVVVEKPGRHVADQGAVPAHQTVITLPYRPVPPQPIVTDVNAVWEAIYVRFDLPEGTEERVTRFNLGMRRTPSGAADPAYESVGFLQADERIAAFPHGIPGQSYDLQITAEDGRGRKGEPVYELGVVASNDVPEPVNLVLAETSYQVGYSGFPALLITADPNTQRDIVSMEVELSSDDRVTWSAAGSTDSGNPRLEVRSVLPETEYYVRARFMTARGVSSDWVEAGPHTTNPVFAESELAVDWGILGDGSPEADKIEAWLAAAAATNGRAVIPAGMVMGVERNIVIPQEGLEIIAPGPQQVVWRFLSADPAQVGFTFIPLSPYSAFRAEGISFETAAPASDPCFFTNLPNSGGFANETRVRIEDCEFRGASGTGGWWTFCWDALNTSYASMEECRHVGVESYGDGTHGYYAGVLARFRTTDATSFCLENYVRDSHSHFAEGLVQIQGHAEGISVRGGSAASTRFGVEAIAATGFAEPWVNINGVHMAVLEFGVKFLRIAQGSIAGNHIVRGSHDALFDAVDFRAIDLGDDIRTKMNTVANNFLGAETIPLTYAGTSTLIYDGGRRNQIAADNVLAGAISAAFKDVDRGVHLGATSGFAHCAIPAENFHQGIVAHIVNDGASNEVGYWERKVAAKDAATGGSLALEVATDQAAGYWRPRVYERDYALEDPDGVIRHAVYDNGDQVLLDGAAVGRVFINEGGSTVLADAAGAHQLEVLTSGARVHTHLTVGSSPLVFGNSAATIKHITSPYPNVNPTGTNSANRTLMVIGNNNNYAGITVVAPFYPSLRLQNEDGSSTATMQLDGDTPGTHRLITYLGGQGRAYLSSDTLQFDANLASPYARMIVTNYNAAGNAQMAMYSANGQYLQSILYASGSAYLGARIGVSPDYTGPFYISNIGEGPLVLRTHSIERLRLAGDGHLTVTMPAGVVLETDDNRVMLKYQGETIAQTTADALRFTRTALGPGKAYFQGTLGYDDWVLAPLPNVNQLAIQNVNTAEIGLLIIRDNALWAYYNNEPVARTSFNGLEVGRIVNSTAYPARVQIRGGGSGATNAELVLIASNSNHYCGLGVFMHDEGGDTEWYAGTPYADGDSYVITRKSATAAHDSGTANPTGTNVTRFMRVENDGTAALGLNPVDPAGYFASGGLAVSNTNPTGGHISRILIDPGLITSGWNVRLQKSDSGFFIQSESNSRPIFLQVGSPLVTVLDLDPNGVAVTGDFTVTEANGTVITTDDNRVYLRYQSAAIAWTTADALRFGRIGSFGGKAYFQGASGYHDWAMYAQAGASQFVFQNVTAAKTSILLSDTQQLLYGDGALVLTVNASGVHVDGNIVSDGSLYVGPDVADSPFRLHVEDAVSSLVAKIQGPVGGAYVGYFRGNSYNWYEGIRGDSDFEWVPGASPTGSNWVFKIDYDAAQVRLASDGVHASAYRFSNDTASRLEHNGTRIMVIEGGNSVASFEVGSVSIWNGNPLDFEIHDSFIRSAGENRIQLRSDGLNLYDGSAAIALQLRDTGVTLVGRPLTLGAVGLEGGELVLQGYSGGSTNWILDAASIDQLRIWQQTGSKMVLTANEDGDATLYHNGLGRVSTLDDGARISSVNGSFDLGDWSSQYVGLVYPDGKYLAIAGVTGSDTTNAYFSGRGAAQLVSNNDAGTNSFQVAASAQRHYVGGSLRAEWTTTQLAFSGAYNLSIPSGYVIANALWGARDNDSGVDIYAGEVRVLVNNNRLGTFKDADGSLTLHASTVSTTGGRLILEGEGSDADVYIQQDAGSFQINLFNGTAFQTFLTVAYDGNANFSRGGVLVMNTAASGVKMHKALLVGAPTGSWKGDGSINAQNVYDDDALLSCYVLEHANTKAIDVAKWDSRVPDRILESGILVPRRHDPMRKFMARLGTEYDPLTLEGYARHWKDKGHLPSMPNEDKFSPEENLSSGQWIQRLLEDAEIKAVLIEELNKRLTAQEAGASLH
ncbi:TipJ family phage tail tip protein [Hyphobacterium sp.]|uniref:TipJ family phage tail tip protein n=1 Tax=Hyphobacterium sp. TaxID=2004662 RepID=UPI003BAA217B